MHRKFKTTNGGKQTNLQQSRRRVLKEDDSVVEDGRTSGNWTGVTETDIELEFPKKKYKRFKE